MPASIFTSWLLWSSLLAGGDHRPHHVEDRAFAVATSATVRSSERADEPPWVIGEADLEEEDSSDGDPEAILGEYLRPWASTLVDGSNAAIRLARDRVTRRERSPILRC